MSKIVQFQTAHGPVNVELDDANATRGETLAGNSSGVTTRATKTFEEALGSLKPGISAALDLFAGLARPPEEAELAFGVKLDAAAGALFAKVGAEATFSVTLKWKRQGA